MKIRTVIVKSTQMGDGSAQRAAYNGDMADVAFVLTIIVFFGLAALFVRFCDSVIGSDETVVPDSPAAATPEQRAA